MEVIVGKNIGFCYGVKRALSGTSNVLSSYNEVSSLGEIIHNEEIINELISKGLTIESTIENTKDNVIIRAHGVSKETYDKLHLLKKNVFDYTCPNVLKIHALASKYSQKGYFITLVGKKTHPEVIGTISFCGKNSCIIENISDIDILDKEYDKMLIISQTTFNMDKFNEIVSKIRSSIKVNNLIIKNTICNETIRRQEEAESLSKEVDYMVVVGDRMSSNAKELYNRALNNCDNTILITNELELPNDIYKYDKVGVISSASTPIKNVNNIVRVLKKY